MEPQKETSSALCKGGLFASFRGKMINPLVVKDILFEGVANFLTEGGKKTPLALRAFFGSTPPFGTGLLSLAAPRLNFLTLDASSASCL